MDSKILNQEKEHLSETLKKVEVAKRGLEESLSSLDTKTIKKLKDLRETPETNSADFFMFLEEIGGQYGAFNLKDRFARLAEMGSLLNEPYFARLDLGRAEYEDEKTIYIGKFGFAANNKPVVTDWRSKIASIYYRYRYPQKNVSYQTPEGEKIRDLLLKRTFEINDGKLIKYYNNDIQLDETEIITQKIESRTGGVLEDIVETIQESQLDIIEYDPRLPCVVQGCVGSGKSTVAIHKLSHIFFNYPKLINPKKSILITKSQILVSYLSSLFPKLGIFDINYKTISDLIYNFAYRENLPILVDMELPIKEEMLNMAHLDLLKKLVHEVSLKTKQDIEKIFERDEYEAFGGYKYDFDITPYENLLTIREDLQEELNDASEKLKENPDSKKSWLYKLNADISRKIILQISKTMTELKTKNLNLTLKSAQIPIKGKLDYASALAFSFLWIKLIGFNKEKTLRYQFCVVDEGQDFSPLELAVLNLFVVHSRICILGDLNQSLAKTGISSWEDLEKILEYQDIKQFILDTNYRSTQPIIKLANQVLEPFTKNYLPKSINRRGENPVFVPCKSMQELEEKLKENLWKDAQEYKKSIGIITYQQDYFEMAKMLFSKMNLQGVKKFILESDQNINYQPKAIYLVKFEYCKGLEFGKVYLVGKNPLDNATFEEARKSFVGVTRAMDELTVYYIDNPNKLRDNTKVS